MKVGYARGSTKNQTPEKQISKPVETGFKLLFEEKTTGAKSDVQHMRLCWNNSVQLTSWLLHRRIGWPVNARTAAHRRGIDRKKTAGI